MNLDTLCPILGCNNSCRDGHAMCGSCWAKLPQGLRKRIHRSNRVGKGWLAAMLEAQRLIGNGGAA